MRRFPRITLLNAFYAFAFFSLLILVTNAASAQIAAPPRTQLGIKSFVLYGGDDSGNNLFDTSNYAVRLGKNVKIQGRGFVGSDIFIESDAGASIEGNIFSGNRMYFRANNTVTGNMTVFNSAGANLPLLMETNPDITGNIISNGNVQLVLPGSVKGSVFIPVNAIYTGPVPTGGVTNGTITLPLLPDMPGIAGFETGLSTPITTTQTIVPGNFGDINLGGGQTLTFSGPGTYIINGINNDNVNNFVFDFKNATTGAFKIFIQGNARLVDINVSMINGGSAARIFTELHGSGNPDAGSWAFELGSITTTRANWLGTVYAPFGGIRIGAGAGIITVNGGLWSSRKVFINDNVTVNFVPLSSSADPNQNSGSPIVPYYPPPGDGKVTTKIGSELQSLYENFTSNPQFVDDSVVYRIYGDKVYIEVIAQQGQYNTLKTKLISLGLTDTISNGPGSLIITGKFPIANLNQLNEAANSVDIDYCRPLFHPMTNSGIVTTQGDSAMRSNYVRNGFNLTGAGVKIGVISDSYDRALANPASTSAATDITNKDLPGAGNPDYPTPVDVQLDYLLGNRSDEGRAMLQIIHDVAPASPLAFRTGFNTAGDFAQGIRQLANDAGCKIIVDDITYITEPFLKDGVVARAVNEVMATNGVAYFSAAGNFGRKSYEGSFTSNLTAPPGVTGIVHDFGSGNYLQNLTLQPGVNLIVLQWEDNFYSLGGSTGAANDLDIYLVDGLGGTLFGFNRDNTGGDPLEIVAFTVTGTVPVNAKLMVVKASGSSNVKFKYIMFRGTLAIPGYAGASTLVGQANAEGAIAVGAVRYINTPAFNPPLPSDFGVASFSSVGGTLIEGINRNKPDLVAPNGANTTVFMGFPPPDPDVPTDLFPNFFGTSASAPHAAAVAALLIHGRQKYLLEASTPAQIKTLMQSTAIDMGLPGADVLSGAGLVEADRAMRTIANPKPLIISLNVPAGALPSSEPIAPTTPFTVTIRGAYLSSSTIVKFNGNQVPNTFVNTQEITAEIPSFTGNPSVQLYTPPLTPNRDGGFSPMRYFYEKTKTTITVKVDNKTKKYAEPLPVFTSTILVDGDSIQHTSLTPFDLKLNNLVYHTAANNASNVGLYGIRVDNPIAPDDPILNTYDYNFVTSPGAVLQIQPLPLLITPRDTAITYGKPIRVNFNYDIPTTFTLRNRDSVVAAIKVSHKAMVADSILALVNGGGGTTDTRALVNELDSLSIIFNGGGTTDTRALVNDGSGEVSTTYIVDVAAQTLEDYKNHPAIGILVNGGGGTTDTRALVNTDSLLAGLGVIVNGGVGTTDTRALVNDEVSLINSTSVNTSSNSNMAIIVNGTDVPATGPVSINNSVSINMITGLNPGIHAIVPAAFISPNYSIGYGKGTLYINSIFTKATNKIQTKLKCIELAPANTGNFKYVAHFYYENPNKYNIYILIGANNNITPSGKYGGAQPVVFLPGISQPFDIYFTDPIKWTLTTIDRGVKLFSATAATTTSPVCKGATLSSNAVTIAEDLTQEIKERVYPNPTTSRLTVLSTAVRGNERTVSIVDASGRMIGVKVMRSVAGQMLELDVSGLKKGVYFIRLESKVSAGRLSFIKM